MSSKQLEVIYQKKNQIVTCASCWYVLYIYITMHDPQNIKWLLLTNSVPLRQQKFALILYVVSDFNLYVNRMLAKFKKPKENYLPLCHGTLSYGTLATGRFRAIETCMASLGPFCCRFPSNMLCTCILMLLYLHFTLELRLESALPPFFFCTVHRNSVNLSCQNHMLSAGSEFDCTN
jgi:hypothetical protein